MTFVRLTADVHNPTPDRRSDRFWARRPVIIAGTLLIYSPSDPARMSLGHYRKPGGYDKVYETDPLGIAIAAAAAEVSPATDAEAFIYGELALHGADLQPLLVRMVESGKLSREDLRAAIAAWSESDEPGGAA